MILLKIGGTHGEKFTISFCTCLGWGGKQSKPSYKVGLLETRKRRRGCVWHFLFLHMYNVEFSFYISLYEGQKKSDWIYWILLDYNSSSLTSHHSSLQTPEHGFPAIFVFAHDWCEVNFRFSSIFNVKYRCVLSWIMTRVRQNLWFHPFQYKIHMWWFFFDHDTCVS